MSASSCFIKGTVWHRSFSERVYSIIWHIDCLNIVRTRCSYFCNLRIIRYKWFYWIPRNQLLDWFNFCLELCCVNWIDWTWWNKLLYFFFLKFIWRLWNLIMMCTWLQCWFSKFSHLCLVNWYFLLNILFPLRVCRSENFKFVSFLSM